jgi:hypothetical protein
VLLLLAPRRPHTPLDGLAAGAAVGLGFQVAEDLVYTIRAMPVLGPARAIVEVLWVRGVVSGLWSHALYTAIAGYGIGYAVIRRNCRWRRRLGVALGCLVGAAALHSLWNSPLLGDPRDIGLGQPAKGIVALVFFAMILVAGQRRESQMFLPYLALPGPGAGAASRTECADLRDGPSRIRAQLGAFRQARSGGLGEALGGMWEQGRLQRAQSDAAVAVSYGRAAEFTLARGQIHGARTRLRRIIGPVGSALPPSAEGSVPPVPVRRGWRAPSLQAGRSAALVSMVLAVFGVLELAVALASLATALLALRLSRGSGPARNRARQALLLSAVSVVVSAAVSVWTDLV